MEACLEKKKPTSPDRKPEATRKTEAPAENARVIPVEEPKKKRRRDRKLATERCHQELKDMKKKNCGPQKRLAVAHRGTTHCAKVGQKTPIDRKMSRHPTVAWRKRNLFRKSTMQENWGSRNELAADRNMTSRAGVTRRKVDLVKNYSTGVNADQETRKGRTRIKNVGDRRPLCQKKMVTTENAIGGCRSEQQSHLGRRGTRKMIFYEIVGRKTAKQIPGSSVGLRQDKDWTLWMGRPPPKQKKGKRPLWEEPVVEVPASLARMNERRMKVTNECDTARPCKCLG
jgi:hypothetical protein